MGCGGNGDRTHRHNSILFSAAQSAALAPRKEVPSLIPGTSSRPADIFFPNWCRGHSAALDVTMISTLQSLTLVGAVATQGHALRVEEERKMATHNEACLSVGVVFIPLVVESLGGWSEEAVHNITRIGRLLWQCTGAPPTETTRHLFQRLHAHLIVERQCFHVDSEAPYHPAWVDGII